MSETVMHREYGFSAVWQGPGDETGGFDIMSQPADRERNDAVTLFGIPVPGRRRLPAMAFAALLCGGVPAPALAQFFVCNQTFDVTNLAVGQFSGEDFETTGWWTIGPNQCATVIDKPLTSRFVYVFAQDVFGRVVLGGAAPMCVASGRFRIQGSGDCIVRGFIEARFREVDTRQSEQWTLFLYPP